MDIFNKFKLGLNKSSKSISLNLNNLIFKKKINQNNLDELEDFLIEADVGVEVAAELKEKFSNIKINTEEDAKDKLIPTRLWGRHSLEAWGERMEVSKSKLEGDDVWATFRPEMADYCIQDVSVTSNLKMHFDELEYSLEAIELEHSFATVIQRQIEYGFKFDIHKAQELYVKLLIVYH